MDKKTKTQEIKNHLYDYERFVFGALEDKGFEKLDSQELYTFPLSDIQRCFSGKSI